MSGGLLFSLCTLNFLDVIFKESNVPLQIINQVLVPLYDLLLACYRVILDDTTIVKSSMKNCQHRQAHQEGENGTVIETDTVERTTYYNLSAYLSDSVIDDATLLDATGRWYATAEYLGDTCYAIDVMLLLLGLSQQHLCLLI